MFFHEEFTHGIMVIIFIAMFKETVNIIKKSTTDVRTVYQGGNMRIRELAIIFLSLIIMLAGLAIPLWWGSALPVLNNFPAHMAELSNNISSTMDLIKESIHGIINIILDIIHG